MRWRFDDPTDGSFYIFEMSASEGGTPGNTKTITTKASSGPGGAVVLLEGRDAVQELSFEGTILTEPHYNALLVWFNKRHAVQLTDDLGRVYRIYITEFTPTRKRAAQHPFKHTYTMKATVIR